MRRVLKATAVVSLLVALTGSTVFAAPRSNGPEPVVTKIAKFVRHLVGLDTGDISWPHP
jgi:hypothetical protein